MPGIDTSQKRRAVIRDFLTPHPKTLLDIGSGPVNAGYALQDCADQVTCLDWDLRQGPDLPANVTTISADFINHDFGDQRFEAIVSSDVFEHVQLEQEAAFVAKCHSLLVDGGRLVISVPHSGTYAWLDPYEVKPGIQRLMSRFGLYRKLHNGTCDIRKGHKHYTEEELVAKFAPFEPARVEKYGHLYEPLGAWADSLARRGVPLPANWLNARIRQEDQMNFGAKAFSMAVQFTKRAA